MPTQKINAEKAKKILDKFSKVQRVRQKSLEILIRIDKKAGEYKLGRLKKKLEDLIK